MIKIKIFTENYALEDRINSFFKETKGEFIDIKFLVESRDGIDYTSAIVIYKEEGK